MPQDTESGSQASRWGRETARRIATVLGATDLAPNSNQCVLNRQRAVIKCAAPATTSVGVTYRMLDRIDLVVGAFQIDADIFELWSLTPEQYKGAMRDTASKGPSAGRVGIVRKADFEKSVRSLGRISLS